MILETLLTASIETGIGLLAQAGFGDELDNLLAKWRNADERKRQAALKDALVKAYQGIRNPEHAETLRSWANHPNIRREIAMALLDPNHMMDVQAVAAQMSQRFPFQARAMNEFFFNLENALRFDAIWGPPLERFQEMRQRADVTAKLTEQKIDLTTPLLVERLDTYLDKNISTGTVSQSEKSDITEGVPSTSEFTRLTENFIQQTIGGIYVSGERGVVAAQGINDSIIATGDNNSITQIITIYRTAGGEGNEALLREQIVGYLNWVQTRYGTIELRGVRREGQQVVQLDLEKVYVPLSAQAFRTVPELENRELRLTELARSRRSKLESLDEGNLSLFESGRFQPIDLNQVLESDERLIITGGPGSGKTTVLQHIAWTLATSIAADKPGMATDALGIALNQDDVVGALPLPIFIPLSAYAQQRKQAKDDRDPRTRRLADFISSYLIEKQAGLDLPSDFFIRLLRQGSAVILLLDGLDEVPDEHERIAVREAIEHLVAGQDEMMVAVTCRTAAYKGRNALGQGFREVQVQPLTSEHVASLVTQAYRAVYSDPHASQDKAKELLLGIENLEQERQQRQGHETEPLVNSPLMVRMLLVVHLSQRRLPEHRAELYMRATDTMLWPEHTLDEEAAERIGRLVGGDLETHRELVQYLALHMHDKGEEQGREIDEDGIRHILNDVPEFKPLTEDFLALTRLRGTLLEERMGTYKFIHLAFQEYLAARYIAEVIRGEGGVPAMVEFFGQNRLLDSWWREVVLLMVGYLSLNTQPTARLFVRRLAGLAENTTRIFHNADMDVAAIELAATACWEWLSRDELLVPDMKNRLAYIFETESQFSSAQPILRARSGRALSQLGDSRPGVGLNSDELPDIAWCNVDEGPFLMGTTPEEEEKTVALMKEYYGDEYEEKDVRNWIRTEQPHLPNKSIHQPYKVSRYPVTVAQFHPFIQEEGYLQEEFWTEAGWQWRTEGDISGPEQYSDVYQTLNHPQVGISWYEAAAYCNWLSSKPGYSVRLPTESEWEKAARGSDGRMFSWKGDFDKNYLNMRDSGIGQTSSVGIFPQGTSPSGCCDMCGNIWEWCTTEWADNYEGHEEKASNDAAGFSHRVVRGGSFLDLICGVRCASRGGDVPDVRSADIGFRILSPGL